MKIKKIVLSLGLLGSGLLTRADVVPVDPAIPAYQSEGASLAGQLTLGTIGERRKIMAAWVALFRARHPQVTCDAKTMESVPAFAALATGDIQVMAMASFPEPNENPFSGGGATYVRRTTSPDWPAGYDPFGVTVSKCTYDPKTGLVHAMAICVNKENDLSQLTVPQLDAIFTNTRHLGAPAAITTWEELGCKNFPVHAQNGRAESHKINLFGRDIRSLKYYAFKQELGLGEYAENLALIRYDEYVPTSVEANPLGIGSFEMFEISPNDSWMHVRSADVKYVAIADREGLPAYLPTVENVMANKYPLFRGTYLYVNRKPFAAIDPLTKEFLRLILSKEGQSVAAQNGVLPLSADEVKSSLAMLEGDGPIAK